MVSPAISNRQSAFNKSVLLVVSLILFPSCAPAQHMNSNQPMDHHTESATAPESNRVSEAQDWARQRLAKSPRHQEWVKVKYKPTGSNSDREVSAFIVYPEVKTKATAVIVIHEIFGMSDWVQSLSDQLAEAGYVAIAPDLLSGMGPNGGGTAELRAADSNAVGKAIRDLPPNQITADLNAVADYVSTLPATNGKVAVAGFCWGGSQSFRYATDNPNLKAAFVFYGAAPTKDQDVDKEAVARIKAPVYGFYAGNDARINATVPKTSEIMKELKKKYEGVTYDGAGHGFMRAGEDPSDNNPSNKKAREEAWTRWKAILSRL